MANPLSGKVLVLELLPKIFLANQIAGFFKGVLSGLIQFLATERPLKVMKNAFYFTSKAIFVLRTS